MQDQQQLEYITNMSELLIQIIQRARTFQILKWHYHNPTLFSPYRLASLGYQCVELNTVQCHICHNRVVMTNEEGLGKTEQQLNQQLNNHHISCSYRNQPQKCYSRAELYLRMDQLIQGVKQSYKNGAAANTPQKLLPLVKMKKFRTQISNTNQLQMLNSIIVKYKMDPKDCIRISFVLTVLGWQRKNYDSLQCAFCGRCINVREYKNTSQDKQKYCEIEQEEDKDDFFDIFGQHRYFCLWVYDQKGWQIYIQYMYDKLGQAEQLFKNQDPQSIQKIRTLIDVYLQKFKNIIGQNFQKANKILTECEQMITNIEENEQESKRMTEQVTKRKKQMSKFLEDIQCQVRIPLKRIKID